MGVKPGWEPRRWRSCSIIEFGKEDTHVPELRLLVAIASRAVLDLEHLRKGAHQFRADFGGDRTDGWWHEQMRDLDEFFHCQTPIAINWAYICEHLDICPDTLLNKIKRDVLTRS